ncbi:MAG: M23 family peptidase, partial [Bacillota bacterium]|nr:M23 family peptidase [Bacillota bacterium]
MILALLLLAALVLFAYARAEGRSLLTGKDNGVIKWVDFDVPYEALEKAMELDIESRGTETHLDWIQLLA